MLTALTISVRNATGLSLRRAVWNGRHYLVVPITMIVPGVLPGSSGALFYPQQEVSNNVHKWNRYPITVNHPLDPLTNDQISAKERGVWARQGIGRLRNTVFNGKLRAEGWIDIERANSINGNVVRNLEAGRPMEVSTGLFVDKDPEPGTYNGRTYDYIAKNYRPDHLAILPDNIGACSVRDGCGANVVNANPFHDEMGRFASGAHEESKESGSKEALAHSQKALAAHKKGDLKEAAAHHLRARDAHIKAGDNYEGSRIKHSDASFSHGNTADHILRKLKIPYKKFYKEMTGNEANFVSEDQRRYLWANEPDIAESWAHGQHTSEEDHRMPGGPGASVKGPQAKKARKRQRPTENADMSRSFWQWFADTVGRRALVTNAERCPECGGATFENDEDDVECRKCGYVENTVPTTVDDGGSETISLPPPPPSTPTLGQRNKRMARNDGKGASISGGVGGTVGGVGSTMSGMGAAGGTKPTTSRRATRNGPPTDRPSSAPTPSGGGPTPAHEPADAESSVGSGSGHGGTPRNNMKNKSGQATDPDAPARGVGGASQSGEDGRGVTAVARVKPGAGEWDEPDDHTSEAIEEGQDDIESDGAGGRVVKKKGGTVRNRRYTVNWLKLFENDPLYVVNMPAGAAFEGAKSAGYSPAQAAAMAGKLEGSYEGEGEGSPGESSRGAKEASSHAEKSKSKSAHKKAAQAHEDAAEHHDAEGNKEQAQSHKTAARSHRAKAARMIRNEIIENCTCPHTRAALLAHNAGNGKAEGSNASASGSGSDQAGGEEEFDDDEYPESEEQFRSGQPESDAGNLDPSKVRAKGKGMSTNMREEAQFLRTFYQQARTGIINQLVANAANKQAARQFFGSKSLRELQQLATLLPQRTRQQQPTGNSYIGAGVLIGQDFAPTSNSDDDDKLIPTINWSEAAAENHKQGR